MASLGEKFKAYLDARHGADHLAEAEEDFRSAIKSTGVQAVLGPVANVDGSLPIAVANSDGTFTVVTAVCISTEVPDVPAPALVHEPEPPPAPDQIPTIPHPPEAAPPPGSEYHVSHS